MTKLLNNYQVEVLELKELVINPQARLFIKETRHPEIITKNSIIDRIENIFILLNIKNKQNITINHFKNNLHKFHSSYLDQQNAKHCFDIYFSLDGNNLRIVAISKK